MKTKKLPATESQVIEFFENMDAGQVKQFMDRIILGKKPKKATIEKLDRLCWQCDRARLNTCPKTKSHKAPRKGVQSCGEWFSNPHVDYGDSPAKKRAIKNLLKKHEPLQPRWEKIYEDHAIELFVTKASFIIIGKVSQERGPRPYSWRIRIFNSSDPYPPIGREIYKRTGATLFVIEDNQTTIIEIVLDNKQTCQIKNFTNNRELIVAFDVAPAKPKA